jgi:hypothetical protein
MSDNPRIMGRVLGIEVTEDGAEQAAGAIW